MHTRGISEIVLIIEDVRHSARFYAEAVGLTVEWEADDTWAWFWAGEPGQHSRIALHKGTLLFEEMSPLPDGERWGQVHFALEVPSEELDAALKRVREYGVEVYGPKHFEWMQAQGYYFYDPDGNLVEFWSPDAAE